MTPRRYAYLQAFRDLTQDRGYPPTIRELGEAVGVTSTNAIQEALNRLESDGMLTRSGSEHAARCWRMTPLGELILSLAEELGQRFTWIDAHTLFNTSPSDRRTDHCSDSVVQQTGTSHGEMIDLSCNERGIS